MITVNLYAQIRKLFVEGNSLRNISRLLGISRNTVKKYSEGCAHPLKRKTPLRQATTLTEEVITFIKECLEDDARENLKKQRHTARCIYHRLKSEKGFTGGESTIRRKVNRGGPVCSTDSDAFIAWMRRARMGRPELVGARRRIFQAAFICNTPYTMSGVSPCSLLCGRCPL